MNSWKKIIEAEAKKPYFKSLYTFLENEYETKIIYPKREDLFNCFKLVSFEEVKVVIIGQDPYHQKGQSHGLCFSVLKDCKTPPSLRNIFNELNSDLNIDRKDNTNLSNWASQGILLLNKVLSVEESKPTSHSNKGWETFTDRIIMELNKREDPIIFVLWGNNAKVSKKLITNNIHYIIESSHPSPLSAYHSFNGSKPFSKINNILKSESFQEIDWSL